MTSLAELRKTYALDSLDEADADANPIRQFNAWLAQAFEAQLPEPNAMTLATVDEHGRPSTRIVLIKGVDERGFVFFTNYTSRKGVELAHNPHASLLFYWIELERQVRIEGLAHPIDAAESDAYYASRPLGSRLGAWASPQSKVIENRAWLEAREHEVAAQYGDHPPRPPHWGGYRLAPDRLEFWQGRPSRLHDRLRYTRDANGEWRMARLAP
ncbi:pyridoxamine 5'-phosphate oxidase [Paraburkholderia hayleyella]|uniref:pyridoxamine 5'-phosphate oxidase n=1 Tax=Paraburkholderia hayleyella TaxID=2152889 RepID=UPI00129260E1|nr:pyridoxamine 5'-phosphate oxidase [Paraburkholderia hayleyella]